MRPKRGLIGPLFAVLTLWVIARRWFDVVEVRGRSMAPSLLPGDRLVVLRTSRPPRRGEIVLAVDPREARRELLKRVAGLDRSGVHLRGDNAVASTDSRTFGAISGDALAWRVVFRYWPLNRFGPIPSAPDSIGSRYSH